MALKHASEVQNKTGSIDRHLRLVPWLLGSLLALALLWTLRATMMFTLPLAYALFVALAVLPVCNGVARRLPPKLKWLGYVAAMGVMVGFLALFVGGLVLAAQQVAGSADELIPQIQQRIRQSPIASTVAGAPGVSDLLGGIDAYARSLASGLGNSLAGLVLVFFLILLMLSEAGAWRAKLSAISGRDRGRDWAEVAAAIGQRFRRYFLTRLFLGAITGLLYAAWLALFGIPLLLVWAMLALLLNFIPTIGSLIAGVLPVLFALAQKDPGTAAIIAVGILAIEQVMGNYVDPKIVGHQLSLSPLVVLASLSLWTWVWGLPGALLAVPMTVLITIVFAHLSPLKPLALFLSNERDMKGLEQRTAPMR